MNKKLSVYWYFCVILIVFLVACGKQDSAPPTETPIPTAVSPTSVPTAIFIPATITPSPLPPQPTIAVITPDSIQVERWKEYETALAKSLLSFLPPEEVLCEWEILERSDQEIYVWTVCMSIIPFGTTTEGKDIFSSSSTPAVIHLGAEGVVQSVEIPGAGSDYARDIHRMFPTAAQEKFNHYHFGRAGQMSEHIEWRRTHPEEPPLIVLGATPTP